MSSIAKRLGSFTAAFKANADSKDANLKEAGIRIDTDRTLAARLEHKWKLELLLLDESIDIADKVSLLSAEIEMVAEAWGRGGDNPEWTLRYNEWRRKLVIWRWYERRRFDRIQTRVTIERKVELTVAGGQSEIEKITESVSPSTAIAYLLDGKAEIKSQETLRIRSDHEMKDEAFSRNQREKFVQARGEEMIMFAYVLLNWSWKESDVTTKAVMVFHNQQQGMPLVGAKKDVPDFSSPDFGNKPSDKK